MTFSLSEGALNEIMAGGNPEKPIMQILGLKLIPGERGERYRLKVWDGRESNSFAMLACQLNNLVNSKEMDVHAIVRVDKYVCNQVQPDKRIMIILEVTVLVKGSKVGKQADGSDKFASDSNSSTEPQRNANVPENSRTAPERKIVVPDKKPVLNQGSMYSATPSATIKSFPISSLTPYQNSWTICARVTNKSAISTWNNSKGSGKLFSLVFLDESGEIRATGFNEECERLHPILEENKVYYISSGQLKPANKTYSHVNNNFEMVFRRDTVVSPCDDVLNMPKAKFDFVPIKNLVGLPKDTLVDVIGICKSCGDVQELTSRQSNREMKKRDVYLADDTNTQVTLTLWGDTAESFDGQSNPVLAIKGARVSDFGGCSLNMGRGGLTINPEIPEAYKIKAWFQREGSHTESQSLSTRGSGGGSSEWKYLRQVMTEKLGTNEKGDYFTAKATIISIKQDNCLYKACPSANCNKKLVDQGNGNFRCEKCNKDTSDFKWRLLLQLFLADFSSNIWITCFQEVAEVILGKNADELGMLQTEDNKKFIAFINSANFKEFIFKLRTKAESFNDETRTKTTAISVNEIDYRDYSKKLIADLKNEF